ncbi:MULTISPECIES: hypothetical protein [unclassified Pseudoalteromonas]|uniref:hypothetical protein n=1 Tax=unclassified Pseudoalteromonas TaxID=194690 RepID=UPI003015503B
MKNSYKIASILALLSFQVTAQQLEFYSDTSAFSNISPIMDIAKDKWQVRPQSDADNGHAQARFGVSLAPEFAPKFSIHLLQRADYFINTNPDTALGYYQEHNNLPLLDKETYAVQLEYMANRSKGAGIAYQHTLTDSLTLEFQANYWYVDYFRHTVANGEVRGRQDNSLLGSLDYYEHYSHNNFLKRPNNGDWQDSGNGYSVDFSAHWQLSSALTIAVAVKDWLNRFEANDAGYSEANINTKGSFIENEGFNSFRPLLRGFEGEDSYHYRLPKQIKLTATQATEFVTFIARLNHQAEQNFFLVGAELPIHESLRLKLLLDTKHFTPEISLSNSHFGLTIAMDDITPNQAKQLSLGAFFRLEL